MYHEPEDNMRPSEVRAQFRLRGQTIRAWAEQHSFPPGLVYAVLAGRLLGERGRAHEVAVALGIKSDPESLGELPDPTLEETRP